MKVVIVGASFAGITAALAVREQHQAAEIFLLEKQSGIGYLSGGLHLYFQQAIDQLSQATFVTEEQLLAKNIQLFLQHTVVAFDPVQQVVTYKNQGQTGVISYDKLILASGSNQWSQKIQGSQSPKVVKYKYQKDALAAMQQLQQSHSIAIIGGGQIGAEALNDLLALNKKAHLFESLPYLLAKYFDEEMMVPVQKSLSAAGVMFHFNETVESVTEREQQLIVSTSKDQILVDCGLFALNIRPSLEYVADTVKRRRDQTIWVDQYLQTSAANVFAIGDCIDMRHSQFTQQRYLPLVNNAVRSGLVAACNLVRPTVAFSGSLRTIGTKLLDYYVASTGMTAAEGCFYSGEIAVTSVEQVVSPFTGNETIKGKLICDQATGQVLGAQLVSKVNCLEKINTLALSIQTGQTIAELMQNDYFYQPSFANVLELGNQLGAQAFWRTVHED
ncbi:FAD-dependent oxidoreductase [Enterococcus faecalis]